MKSKLLILGIILPFLIQAQTPQTYVTFQGDTTNLYKYEGEKTMLLAKSNALDTVIMQKWTNILDKAYNFYQSCTGREPEFLPNTYINNKSTIASADPTCGGGCGYLGATGIELLDAYFDQSYISILTENKYEQIYFYEMGRNFWFYGNKLSYENDPITTGYAVFMRFMSMKYIGVDDYPSHVDFVNQIRELRTTYLADTTLNWSNTLGVAQGVPESPWGAADLFASFCMYLEETYGWQWLQNVWQYAAQRPDRATSQDAVDNFIIASSQAANTNLVSLFQEWRWSVSQSAIDYINSLNLGEPKFYLDYNGVTIKCVNCVSGDTGRVDGVLYEAVDRDLLIQRKNEGADLSKVCTSPVTDMTYMFGNATAFNQPIGSWDLSNVTNATAMFSGASEFNQPIGSWDVSNITSMDMMFIYASEFNQPIGSWNVSNVQKMDSMFMGASAFNQNINDWVVNNVTTMEAMFVSANSFNQNIQKWDVVNVKNMAAMFFDASSFNQAIGSWDVSNVINMTNMFYGASDFNQDLNNWCVPSITAEPDDFSTNSALTENNKPEWGTCPQTYIPDDNFEQALIDLGYDSAPLDNYVKTVKIKKVTTLDVSNKDIEDLTGIEDFSNLSNLKCYANKIDSLDFSQNTSLTYLDCQENQLTNLDVSKNTALTMLNCTRNYLTDLDVSNNTFLTNLTCHTNSLSSLDLSKNTFLYGLGCGSNILTELDISTNTKLRGLECQFNQLTSLDISNNRYINYLNCEDNKLTSLDVSHQGMFLIWLNCGLNSITNIDISKNTLIEHLYCWNNQLSSIDISQNNSLIYFRCENNQLTFESLEPAIDIENFTYSPQDSVGTTQSVSKTKGESYSYYLEIGGEHNIYKWYKDDVLLALQTSATLNLTDLELDDNGVYRCEVTNSIVPELTLYSRKITLDVDNATYAGGNELIENFKVYPNPTSDKLYLETPTNGVVMIYDLNGKIVLNKNIENLKNEIDLSGLVSGAYLLKFDSNGSIKAFQIIKN